MYEVAAIPQAANAQPMSTAAGSTSTAHSESTSPMASITTRNPVAYSWPRMSAHEISPRATSPADRGVARMAS